MVTQRTKNVWKIAGALVMLGFFLAVMLLGPMLREAPRVDESMRLPAMTNVPPPGSLEVEVEPSEPQTTGPTE